ncbi:MAG: hypothetical protein ACREJ5_27985 [Geminicoccaceae bacterium]
MNHFTDRDGTPRPGAKAAIGAHVDAGAHLLAMQLAAVDARAIVVQCAGRAYGEAVGFERAASPARMAPHAS